jgi:dihydrofolate synthase/folylpolyglutamate synthase
MATYTILGKACFSLSPLAEVISQLAGIGMVGRFHSIKHEDTQFIFDVAHNAAGAQWLAHRLALRTKEGKRLGVWSSVVDKNLSAIVTPLIPYIDEWYVGELEENERATPSQALKKILEMQGVTRVLAFSTVKEAGLAAKEQAKPKDDVVVFGSFFTVADVYRVVGLEKIVQTENGLFYG